jgi:hypothetical protein
VVECCGSIEAAGRDGGKAARRSKKSAGAAVTTKPDRAHAAILDLLFNGLAV